jgi:hypothetical protein
MTTSRTIMVEKRDGQHEPFCHRKLAACLWRGLQAAGLGEYNDACELARAIEIYLTRRRRWDISTSVIFELLLKSLRRIRMGEAAEMLELHRTLRSVRRRLLGIRHDDGAVSRWDKTWLVDLGQRMWHIERQTARIIAGLTELDILDQHEQTLSRHDIVTAFNRRVAEFGLADAVPVRQFAGDA